jgi:hypothetical protein
MSLRPAYLSRKLDRPLPTKDGGTLRTIRDACDYMTGMGKKRELRQHWQQAAKLILAEADCRSSVGCSSWPYSWMPSSTYRNSWRNENPNAFCPPDRHAGRWTQPALWVAHPSDAVRAGLQQ